jgi:hypothetical protein
MCCGFLQEAELRLQHRSHKGIKKQFLFKDFVDYGSPSALWRGNKKSDHSDEKLNEEQKKKIQSFFYYFFSFTMDFACHIIYNEEEKK